MSEALKIGEAAKRIGMSVSWLYKRVAEGTIPYLKIGRAVRFDVAQLEAFKAAQLRAVIK